jgi:hypothetical protein
MGQLELADSCPPTPDVRLTTKEEHTIKEHMTETRETVKNLGSNMVNIKPISMSLVDSFPNLDFIQLANVGYSPKKLTTPKKPTQAPAPALTFASNINELSFKKPDFSSVNLDQDEFKFESYPGYGFDSLAPQKKPDSIEQSIIIASKTSVDISTSKKPTDDSKEPISDPPSRRDTKICVNTDLELFRHESEPEFLEGYKTSQKNVFKKKPTGQGEKLLTPDQIKEARPNGRRSTQSEKNIGRERSPSEQQIDNFMRKNRVKRQESMFGICDSLRIQDDKKFMKLIEPGEKVYWSGYLEKVNKRSERQEKRFVLTTRKIYNIGNKGGLDTFKNIFKSHEVRRAIDLTKCEFITYSLYCNEWIMHILDEYDYRLSSKSHRDTFIKYF